MSKDDEYDYLFKGEYLSLSQARRCRPPLQRC